MAIERAIHITSAGPCPWMTYGRISGKSGMQPVKWDGKCVTRAAARYSFDFELDELCGGNTHTRQLMQWRRVRHQVTGYRFSKDLGQFCFFARFNGRLQVWKFGAEVSAVTGFMLNSALVELHGSLGRAPATLSSIATSQRSLKRLVFISRRTCTWLQTLSTQLVLC